MTTASAVGTPEVEAKPSPFARTWPGDAPPFVIGEIADPVPPPILRAYPINLHVERARPSKANPLGNPKSVRFFWIAPKDAEGNTFDIPAIPAQIEKAVRALAAVLPDDRILLHYARGYGMDSKTGGVLRPKIWEERTPDENDDRQKVLIGHGEPELHDSLLLRGVFRARNGRLLKIMGGWWTDGEPDMFQVWTPATGRLLVKNVTMWKKWISARQEDVRVEDIRLAGEQGELPLAGDPR